MIGLTPEMYAKRDELIAMQTALHDKVKAFAAKDTPEQYEAAQINFQILELVLDSVGFFGEITDGLAQRMNNMDRKLTKFFTAVEQDKLISQRIRDKAREVLDANV